MRDCCARCCVEGRLPESAIPPAHVLEVRTLGRLYCALMDERRAWQQRIHAQLFHQGCPPITALLLEAGREALATAELSAAGRSTSTRRCGASMSSPSKSTRCEHNWSDFAGASRGVGRCRPAITGWAGCARRSCGPRSAMRAGSPAPISWCASPGWMSPCTPPMANAHRGICPGRARRSCGGRRLRRPSALPRRGSPDYAYYHQLAANA